MANKKYKYTNSKTAIDNKPAYIPNNYNGHTTVYVGGHYGYMNPMGHFMMYTAADMMITDMMLRSYAPNVYRDTYNPAMQHDLTTAKVVDVVCIIVILLLVVVYLLIKLFR